MPLKDRILKVYGVTYTCAREVLTHLTERRILCACGLGWGDHESKLLEDAREIGSDPMVWAPLWKSFTSHLDLVHNEEELPIPAQLKAVAHIT